MNRCCLCSMHPAHKLAGFLSLDTGIHTGSAEGGSDDCVETNNSARR